MKFFAFVFSLLIGVASAYSQTYKLGYDATVLKNYGVLKKGAKVHLKSMTHDLVLGEFESKPINTYTLNTSVGDITVKEKLEKVLDISYSDAQSFWDAQAIFSVLEDLTKNGTQESMRSEIESDVLEFISRVKKNNLEFNDPYLESYIYSVICKLAPNVLIDGRPGVVNLLILRNNTANAYMFPNGTLVITTGLISLLHSEDELAAILSHEIAHFVLDHSVDNINMANKRKKRAEFWAAFATVLTGVAEGVAAANDPYYKPGLATLAVAVAAEQIANEICVNLGMQYNRKQEQEADDLANELMKVLGYNQNALATALSRIEESMMVERSTEMYFASDHPALLERIKKAGPPSPIRDEKFEKIISFAVSDAATLKMQDRRFRQVLPLVSQNIDNQVATADDYVQKALCLLYMSNSRESDTEVLELIKKAKSIQPENINLYKTEIIAFLRQEKFSEAKNLLTAYKQRLHDLAVNHEIIPDGEWSLRYNFAVLEQYWTDDMIQKLKSF